MTASISGVTIQNGYASGNGGGVFNAGTLTLTSDSILNNTAGGFGGGVFNSNSGMLIMSNCRVMGNTTGSTGGGVWNNGSMTLSNSTIENNSGQWGGGIGSSTFIAGGGPGVATVTGSTIAYNTTTYGYSGGGGVDILGGTLTLSNDTIVNNTTAGSGGGVNVSNGGTLTLSNDTIAYNSAALAGGGICNEGSTIQAMLNTIVVGNTSPNGPDINSSVNVANNNIVSNSSDLTIGSGTGNLLNVSPSLVNLAPTLANNGGTTQTLLPLQGSLAIYAGGAIAETTSAVNPGDTTIYVDNAGGIAQTPGSYEILIGNEVLTVTGVNTSTTPNSLSLSAPVAGSYAIDTPIYLANDQAGDPTLVYPDVGALQTVYAPTVTPNVAGLPVDSLITISGTAFDPLISNDSVSFDNGVTGSVVAATTTSLTVSATGLALSPSTPRWMRPSPSAGSAAPRRRWALH